MKKRIALVTGGSGGIGAAIVKSLHRAGITIALQYNQGKERALDIQGTHQDIHLFQDDFSSADASLIDRVIHKLGSIDFLVNCAGCMANESIFDMDSEDFDRLFTINTKIPYLLAAKAFTHMKEQQFGRIVNISSFTVHYGMGRNNSIHYAGSKAALETLTSGLARLGAEHNILVNSIRPGVILTNMQEGRHDLETRIQMIPVKRMGRPEEIANTVRFLCDDENQFTTGQTITIAGGEG